MPTQLSFDPTAVLSMDLTVQSFAPSVCFNAAEYHNAATARQALSWLVCKLLIKHHLTARFANPTWHLKCLLCCGVNVINLTDAPVSWSVASKGF